MAVTTIILPPGTRDPSMEPTPLVFTRREVKERSTEFVPAPISTDPLQFRGVRQQILLNIEQTSEEDADIVERMNSLSEDIRIVQQLSAKRDEIQERIDIGMANAIVDDTDFDEKPYREKLALLNSEIKVKGKRVNSAKAAIKILQDKRDVLSGKSAKLQKELADINQRWLEARHAELVEKLRYELHLLHATLAEMIAVEIAGDFRVDRGGMFVEQISSAIPHHSPLRPDWANGSSERKSFPGFAKASAAVKAELQGEVVS